MTLGKKTRHFVRSLLNRFSPRTLCRLEYRYQRFERLNERPVELSFVFRHLAALCPETILDVGSGTTALPHVMRHCGFVVTAADNIRDYWPSGTVNRHYHVIDDDITDTRLVGPFDLITCVSVLEHIRKSDDAVSNLFSLLRPGGHLILTVPYREDSYVENVYDLPDSSYGQDAKFVTQSYSRRELSNWLRDNPGTIVEQEYWRFFTGGHWTEGEFVTPPERVGVGEPHQLTCLLIRRDG